MRGVRPLAVAAVFFLVWGGGVAQHPYLLPPDAEGAGGLTIAAAAAPDATLNVLLIVFGIALVIVVPALRPALHAEPEAPPRVTTE